jgi:sensor histidine kinase YesM
MMDAMQRVWKHAGLLLAVGLPIFVLWVLVAVSSGQIGLRDAVAMSAISVSAALVLGVCVWYLCLWLPWPLRTKTSFYLMQVILAASYALMWNLLICCVECVRASDNIFRRYWTSRNLGWQLMTGVFVYLAFAGISYSVQTRKRMHEKELQAIRAEAMAATARMDAIRARLNPHFLFNALHTLSALSKCNPTLADGAFERLGDMLRYALRDDNRELVEFAEELDFTRQYIAFEQLRYEDRLKVSFDIDPGSNAFDVPPFSVQTLAENAVQHAISIRPEGGSIWISSICRVDMLCVTVRDDGCGEHAHNRKSHQFGLKSLHERLQISFGSKATFETKSGPEGFEARFEVPASNPDTEQSGVERA